MDNRTKTSKGNLGKYTSPKWKSGKTVAIRVPELIKDKVLKFAKKIDLGVEENQLTNQVIEKLKYAIQSKGEGGGYDGRKAKELRDRVFEAIEMLEKAISEDK